MAGICTLIWLKFKRFGNVSANVGVSSNKNRKIEVEFKLRAFDRFLTNFGHFGGKRNYFVCFTYAR
jgi:hypothetical protein